MSDSVYTRYRQAFAQAIAAALDASPEEIAPQLKAADPAHGDLSFPTFPLAKAQRKAPPQIAAGLAEKVKVPGLAIAAVGPYLNARFEPLPFTQDAIDEARGAGKAFGSGDRGAGKTVVI